MCAAVCVVCQGDMAAYWPVSWAVEADLDCLYAFAKAPGHTMRAPEFTSNALVLSRPDYACAV